MKYEVILITTGFPTKEDMNMGEVDISDFDEIERLLKHWMNKHEYDAYRLIPKETKTRRKSSKKK